MKKSKLPETRVKNPEPNLNSPDWVIWAAWADRVTFEEIKKKTGKSENDVIKIMRRNLKPSSFRLWRERAKRKSIKHRKKFILERKNLRKKVNKNDFI
ncbi:TIGR03643 family protein [Candidatus Pelagibacter sp.]|nr:TIGR03643 family protein [Candidatus Pelagibacter sp.]|tara:strand:- start:320 stop:613 length:294 start_codon:yes stop_codon:yes gene_type:complete